VQYRSSVHRKQLVNRLYRLDCPSYTEWNESMRLLNLSRTAPAVVTRRHRGMMLALASGFVVATGLGVGAAAWAGGTNPSPVPNSTLIPPVGGASAPALPSSMLEATPGAPRGLTPDEAKANTVRVAGTASTN
jgi:hypothetical protein